MYSADDYLTEEDFYFQRKNYLTSQHAAAVSRLVSARDTNEHLQRLHRRVTDLEHIIRSQGLAISEKDAGHRLLRSQLRELKDIKERQVKDLSTTVSRLQDRNRSLDQEIRRKSDGLGECQKRLMLLNSLLSTSLPAVEKLVADLKNFSSANSDLSQLSNDQDAGLSSEMRDLSLDADLSTANTVSVSMMLANAQFAAENTDSGHPSSASDSYNNVIEDSSAEALGEGTMANGTPCHESSPASHRKQRTHSQLHGHNGRKSNPLFSDSILNELTFSSKASTPINSTFSPNRSPASLTPPVVRRNTSKQQQEHESHISRSVYSYTGAKYRTTADSAVTSSESGISIPVPAEHLASEIGIILNFSDGEGSSDQSDAGLEDENREQQQESAVPPPAPSRRFHQQ